MKNSKPKYVFDATPLIILAKTSLLEHALESCEAYATDQVVKETTENTDYPDAHIIKDCIDRESLKIHSVRNTEKIKTLTRHPEIHLGEAETLTAVEELDAAAVIDDKEARAVAELYNIKTHPGTLFILFRLIQTGKLDRETAETKLDQMINAGLYLDSRTFIAAKNKLREDPGALRKKYS
jgi:predicted nucleic acid-binding protein